MPPATLLIVDDDARVRGLLATLLASQGYSVSRASNGKEALARCQEALPDLVITDLAKKLGADSVLLKPFEPDVILHEVRRLTARLPNQPRSSVA